VLAIKTGIYLPISQYKNAFGYLIGLAVAVTIASVHFAHTVYTRRGGQAELEWLACLVEYRDGMPVQSSILTRLNVE